jgi:hypothetical protein
MASMGFAVRNRFVGLQRGMETSSWAGKQPPVDARSRGASMGGAGAAETGSVPGRLRLARSLTEIPGENSGIRLDFAPRWRSHARS